ncbi:MAG: phage portal protein [Candidatus Binatia bacterium]
MKSFLDQISNLRQGAPEQVRNRHPIHEKSWFGAIMGNTGRRAELSSYGAVSTLFAIVSRNAESCAGVEWGLFKKSKTRKKEERTEISSHALLDLWEKPNPFFDGFEFRETLFQHIDLTGEAYMLVVRSQMASGLPLELWPIRPDRMEPISHERNFLLGWVYNGPNGEQIPLEVEEVIPIYWTDPMNPGHRGLGPVQSLLTDIDSARFSAEWNRNFFINGARPGGIVQVDKRLSDAEWKEMTGRWRDQHQGVGNAHRVAVIEQGKWIETKYTMRDMQFAELRDVSREVIREAFGYPKIMLGTVDDVNRANAEVGEEMYGRWLLTPRLRRLKNAVNNKLLPMFSETTKLREMDFDDPVPESREANDRERDSKSKAALALVTAGYEPDDVVAVLDLPAMKHTGKVFAAQFDGSQDGFGRDEEDTFQSSAREAGLVFHQKSGGNGR